MNWLQEITLPSAGRLRKLGLGMGTALLVTAGAMPAQDDFMPNGAVTQETEEVKYTLLRPGDKTAEVVKEGERNPFGKGEDALKDLDAKGTNEENEIRDRLTRLRVVGVSPGSRGLRVMLGDMVLEPGEMVPQVLPEQTVALRVGAITPRAIELVWVEVKPSGLPPRVLTIPVDLRPYVRYALKGQPNEKNQWDKSSPAGATAAVGTQFPDVAQTPAHNPAGLASSNPSKVTPLVPPASGAAESPLPLPVPGAPGPSAVEVPAQIQLPEWGKAMEMLQKLVPLGKGEEKQ
jgi:hypothetical protein